MPARREDGVGLATFDLEARLGEDGELLLRGPHVFAGYFRDDAATKAALSDDGWLRTGDVFAASDAGWSVIGRKKEMFISGGENVYPAEIEAVLAAHSTVIASAVVGVPDETWGEAGVAFVVADDVDASLVRSLAARCVQGPARGPPRGRSAAHGVGEDRSQEPRRVAHEEEGVVQSSRKLRSAREGWGSRMVSAL